MLSLLRTGYWLERIGAEIWRGRSEGMSDKNYELELYKLIVTPDEEDLDFFM